MAADGGDNDAVTAAAGGDRRIDPRQVVAKTVPETPAWLWLPRLVLGFVAAFAVLVFTGNILGLWFILPAVIVGAVTTWRSNGRRLLQIGAELVGQSAHPLRAPAMPSNAELVSALNILPGDWAYSHLRYQRKFKEAEREYRRLWELAEKRRVASGQTDASQSEYDQSAMRAPAIPLEWVVATAESSGHERLILRFASGDVDDVGRNQQYYRRRLKAKPVSKKSIAEASLALSELLGALASTAAFEDHLLNKLVRSYSDASVHRALRAALSQRLVEQEVGFGRLIREVCAVFSLNMEIKLRQSCVLSLSKAGDAWVRGAGVATSGNASSTAANNKPEPGTVNNFFIGDSTFYTVVSHQAGAVSDDSTAQSADCSKGGRAFSGSGPTKDSDDNSDSLTIAWSAGVSATGAGLAALFLTGEAPWQRAVFISLIFVSGCTFVILICVGLPNLTDRWRARRRKSLGHASDSDEAAN